MFTNGFKRNSVLFNKPIFDYCMKSTNESIRKMVEKANLDNKKNYIKKMIIHDDDDDDDDDDDEKKIKINFYNLFFFLSISSLGIYLYKKIK
jgi:fatty acid-binding protein DegV